jgi:hypothetical protein
MSSAASPALHREAMPRPNGVQAEFWPRRSITGIAPNDFNFNHDLSGVLRSVGSEPDDTSGPEELIR